ncbi:MAG: 50S ribosomal protein L32 [Pyrinomonadaceae bacterium]|nr:50S ribosomal protein L32 [Pyrinomonadaceae bacterium]
MPNPKRRHSKARTRKRRAHDALTPPQFFIDPTTGEPTVPHRLDLKTGMWKGRQILPSREQKEQQ